MREEGDDSAGPSQQKKQKVAKKKKSPKKKKTPVKKKKMRTESAPQPSVVRSPKDWLGF